MDRGHLEVSRELSPRPQGLPVEGSLKKVDQPPDGLLSSMGIRVLTLNQRFFSPGYKPAHNCILYSDPLSPVSGGSPIPQGRSCVQGSLTPGGRKRNLGFGEAFQCLLSNSISSSSAATESPIGQPTSTPSPH